MRVIHLARKPLSESTVATNVLLHGAGAINIGATRIALPSGKGLGRWPANVVFQHREGCRVNGTKMVRSSILNHACGSDSSSGIYSPMTRAHKTGHANPEGLEEVEAWDCAPGCPVISLDHQAGPLQSGSGTIKRRSSAARQGNSGPAYGAESRPDGTPMISYGDAGGASRFFKQVMP